MTFSAEKFNQQQWMGHLFFPNTDGNAHPWLSFRGLFNNTIHLKEWRWLLYMHLGQNEPRIIYKVWYSDGTDITFYRYGGIRVGPYYGRLLHIPIGIEQASLNPYGKKPVKYTVTVTDYNISGGPSTTMAFMEFKVDNRPVHHPLNLIYRNCVGGIETIFLTGVKQLGGASFTKQISERNRYDSGQRGPASYFHSEGTVKFTAHTPYLSEQELILLYDLYNCTEMCGVISAQPHSPRRFYPMRVPEQDMPAIDRDAHLHSYKIEFETAGSFRNMPRNLFNFFRT